MYDGIEIVTVHLTPKKLLLVVAIAILSVIGLALLTKKDEM